jgi:hypothetical protein
MKYVCIQKCFTFTPNHPAKARLYKVGEQIEIQGKWQHPHFRPLEKGEEEIGSTREQLLKKVKALGAKNVHPHTGLDKLKALYDEMTKTAETMSEMTKAQAETDKKAQAAFAGEKSE